MTTNDPSLSSARFGRALTFLIILGLPCLAQTTSVVPPPPGGPVAGGKPIQNLELARGTAGWPQVAGGWVVFSVGEDDQGVTDLNGDLDADDDVVHALHVLTGVIVNLGMASDWMVGRYALNDELVALSVDEQQQGATDLNLDGDLDDNVLHTYHLVTGAVTNLSVSVTDVLLEGSILVSLVDEFESDQEDLNGDLDTTDRIVFVHDLAGAVTLNTGLASADFHRPLLGGSHVVILVDEAMQNADRNGDFDQLDRVLHVFDVATGVSTPIPYAAVAVQRAGDVIAFTVSEIGHGEDLDGDGKLEDEVLFTYRISTGVTTTLGMAVSTFSLKNDLLAYMVDEDSFVDLTMDGDKEDHAVFLHRPSTGVTINALMDGNPFWGIDVDEDLAVWGADEPDHGHEDLNGDGDSFDTALHAHHIEGTDPINSKSAVAAAFEVRGNTVAYLYDEVGQQNDVNGDGDSLDHVVQVWYPLAFTTSNLKLPAQALQMSDRMVLFEVQEIQVNKDLNGDTQINDTVAYVYDLDWLRKIKLGFAMVGIQVLADNVVLFQVNEVTHGSQDLNEDGDTWDHVYHAFFLK